MQSSEYASKFTSSFAPEWIDDIVNALSGNEVVIEFEDALRAYPENDDELLRVILKIEKIFGETLAMQSDSPMNALMNLKWELRDSIVAASTSDTE